MAVVVLAIAVPVTAVSVGFMFWLIGRRHERHLTDVLDRFLSRNLSEFGMTDLVRKEVSVEQQEDVGDESPDDSTFEEWYASRVNAEAVLGEVR